jgi:HD superfamily phosphodiesterase
VNTSQYELDGFLTDPAWMHRQSDEGLYGTHGLGHITRVLVWSAHIADSYGRPLQRAELLWAAAIHDVQRWTDGGDREHGERAARWAMDQFPVIRPDVAASVDLQLVASICRNHVPNDHLITDWTDELRILKDADGLDRIRFDGLDPLRLRLRDITPALEEMAWQLMRASRSAGNTVESVRAVAIELGLWR